MDSGSGSLRLSLLDDVHPLRDALLLLSYGRLLDKLRRGDPSARFILQTAYHGLGNRQRGMISGFALALANKAAFFVDFPTTTCDREADNRA